MNLELIKNFLTNDLNLTDVDSILDKFQTYEKLLLEWNEKFNLTAIKEENEVTEKHFIDSLFSLKYVDFDNKTLLDIGSGAGFPALPLAILNPSLKATLIESNGKKVSFLNEVKNVLKLDNVNIVKSRVEDIKEKEQFDYVSARAVTELRVLLELSIPYLKIGGQLIAYKLFDNEEEIISSKNALKVLDCYVEHNYKFELPLSKSKRSLLVIRKNKKTKNKYPRLYSEISHHPL